MQGLKWNTKVSLDSTNVFPNYNKMLLNSTILWFLKRKILWVGINIIKFTQI